MFAVEETETEEVPADHEVKGRVLAFVDDWSGWRDRAADLMSTINGGLPRRLDSVIQDSWREEFRSRQFGTGLNGDEDFAVVGTSGGDESSTGKAPWESSNGSDEIDLDKPPW
jgi:hypothetical protein